MANRASGIDEAGYALRLSDLLTRDKRDDFRYPHHPGLTFPTMGRISEALEIGVSV